MTVEERIRQVLRGYVGDCTCIDGYKSRNMRDPLCTHCDVDPEELTKELAGIVREAQERVGKRYAELHQKRQDELQAQAWDEAVNHADREWRIGHASAQILKADNPYRKAES